MNNGGSHQILQYSRMQSMTVILEISGIIVWVFLHILQILSIGCELLSKNLKCNLEIY